jgi:hypothetical protein
MVNRCRFLLFLGAKSVFGDHIKVFDMNIYIFTYGCLL